MAWGTDGPDILYNDPNWNSEEFYALAGWDIIVITNFYAAEAWMFIDGGDDFDILDIGGFEDFISLSPGFALGNDGAASITWLQVERLHVHGSANDNLIDLTGAATSEAFANGYEGNDILIGGAQPDILNGGDGNDQLRSAAGSDYLDGGGGEDVLYFGAYFGSGDFAVGGADRDVVVLQGNYSLTLGNYDLFEIEALSLLSGADAQFGDTADNFYDYDITMADGNVAAGQQLTVDGRSLRAGEDLTFDGSAETDGNFLIFGGRGVDTLKGGLGNDVLDGAGGNDSLDGGAGNDVLNGDSGTDQLTGGLGNDRYYIGAGDSVTELTGQGTDEVRTALAAYTLAAEVERLIGLSAGGQRLTGNSLSNVIAGGAGNDVLNGGAGGADQMAGGLGDDVYYLGTGDSVTENADAGTDEVRTGLGSYTLAANVERVTGTAAAQTLTGNDLANFITGGLGADVLNGAGGDDRFEYRSAAEWAGDRVDGGAGTDTVQLDGAMGGSGIAFGAGGLAAVERILLAAAPAGSFNPYNLSFGGGNIAAGTTLLIDGSALRSGERLSVDAYQEKLGALTIYGGANRDVLNGGSQADVLRGGGGGDYLNGNGGADRFVYTGAADSTGLTFDQIAGFDYRVDTIDLPFSVSGWAPAVNQGRLAGATFDADLAAALDAALGASQAVLFRPDSGDYAGRLFAVIDANGDGAYQAGQDYVFEFIAPAVPIAPVTGFFV